LLLIQRLYQSERFVAFTAKRANAAKWAEEASNKLLQARRRKPT
jgi:hypothetical protein